MITFPNAKINLGLNITSKRPDGYHNLETIFYPIPLEDGLEVHLSPKNNSKYHLFQSGNEIAGDVASNLVVKAYQLLDCIYDLPPVDIYLNKHIPSGAGLGGGSSDAAFMLKLLNSKFKLNLSDSELEKHAATLGADCAFFIKNEATFAEGIGNVFTPIKIQLTGYQLYLIKPDVFVSTKDAFAYITPSKPEFDLHETIMLPLSKWKDRMVNDFEKSVFKQFPQIGEIKDTLYEEGALYASMSGSGSSVFGIFPADMTLPEIAVPKESFVFTAQL